MLKSSLVTTLFLLVVCGIIYPLVTTAVGQAVFPQQANGSLIKEHDKVVGSKLIGQEFTSPAYLHGRPSPHHYSSYPEKTPQDQIQPVTGGSNDSNNNRELLQRVKTERQTFSKDNGVPIQNIPVDILTASGSGLDGQITKQAADMQVHRMAQHSGLAEEKIRRIINQHTVQQNNQAIVNILEVNLKIKQFMQS
ncbi:K+-transporting ATPase, C subunit [Staphylococcus agnetis]|uniref:potassium-transporting ATPase subunit KdpC n=1 Tax=Staphylococcus agnetis TaxID=985762 RepID=UPI000E078F47|nr:potassium-transporting ATPase subunit KdpC [Staphylococcus agnetis]SUK02158.1 K+-transporting ATPase, C subunit [Staphylococcus agnetis]